MLSRNLEQTLSRAASVAHDRWHEYTTLDHLLLALSDDQDAVVALQLRGVSLPGLREQIGHYLDSELTCLVNRNAKMSPKPTPAYQRVLQRAGIHPQSSGNEEVTGAAVLTALSTERDSHAVYFLTEQAVTQAQDQASFLLSRRPNIEKPTAHKVLLLNDDETPMELVVQVVEKFFNKNREEATDIMLHVHRRGVGVCGIYTYEVAETKVAQVMDFARASEQPLQCTMEKE